MRVRIPEPLGLPTQPKVEPKLLKLLAARSRSIFPVEVYRILADDFELSLAQREVRPKSSTEPAWNWRVRRAMQRLVAQGQAYHPQAGKWAATQYGRSLQRAREQHGPKVKGVIDEDILILGGDA